MWAAVQVQSVVWTAISLCPIPGEPNHLLPIILLQVVNTLYFAMNHQLNLPKYLSDPCKLVFSRKCHQSLALGDRLAHHHPHLWCHPPERCHVSPFHPPQSMLIDLSISPSPAQRTLWPWSRRKCSRPIRTRPCTPWSSWRVWSRTVARRFMTKSPVRPTAKRTRVWSIRRPTRMCAARCWSSFSAGLMLLGPLPSTGRSR